MLCFVHIAFVVARLHEDTSEWERQREEGKGRTVPSEHTTILHQRGEGAAQWQLLFLS